MQVACSDCQARPGERCIWRGPHGYTYHIGRDLQAMRAGYLTACDALTWDGRHSRHEVLVCDQPEPVPMKAHLATAAVSPQPVQLALF